MVVVKLVSDWMSVSRLCSWLVVLALSVSAHGEGGESSGKSLVLVHGAHLTAESWDGVSFALRAAGYDVLSVNLPGRGDDGVVATNVTLDSSSRALCTKVKASEKGSKLSFVAHSQGGAVVNHLLGLCPEITPEKIIYLAAVVPLDGEKPFDKLSKADEENYYRGVVYDEATGLMQINNPEGFLASFVSESLDEGSALGEEVMRGAVDEPAAIGDGVVALDVARYRGAEKYYIFTSKDKIISLATQKGIAENVELVDSRIVDGGHLTMIVNPQSVSSILLEFLGR